MTFPGAGARIFTNEAGEPIGWDYPSDEPYEDWTPDYDSRWQEGFDEGEWCEGCGEEVFYTDNWQCTDDTCPANQVDPNPIPSFFQALQDAINKEPKNGN